MPELNSNIWKELEGGYRELYNASIPLLKFESEIDRSLIDEIFSELWENLHHQGDVGIASYLSVPHLVRIAIQRSIYNWNVLAICAVIEQQRILGNNPKLPTEFEGEYYNALSELKTYSLDFIKRKYSKDDATVIFSAIATCDGNHKLGKALLNLSDASILDEFLENYG